MNVSFRPSRVGQAKVPTIGPCRHFGRFRRPWSNHVDGPRQSRAYQCLRCRGSSSRLPLRRHRSSVTPAMKNRRGKGVDGGRSAYDFFTKRRVRHPRRPKRVFVVGRGYPCTHLEARKTLPASIDANSRVEITHLPSRWPQHRLGGL